MLMNDTGQVIVSVGLGLGLGLRLGLGELYNISFFSVETGALNVRTCENQTKPTHANLSSSTDLDF